MGFFKDRRLAKMRKKGKCPECRGRGYHAFAGSDFFNAVPSNCSTCEKSGLFSIWDKNNI